MLEALLIFCGICYIINTYCIYKDSYRLPLNVSDIIIFVISPIMIPYVAVSALIETYKEIKRENVK